MKYLKGNSEIDIDPDRVIACVDIDGPYEAEPALLGGSGNQHLQLPVHGFQTELWHITVTMLFLLYFMTSDADCMMNMDRTTAIQRRPDIYNLYTKRIMTAMSEAAQCLII